MTDPTPPQADNLQPLTFRERGLAVLFTTPLLGGARVRPSRKPKVLEVIVPNPSGGRGTYVVEWDGVRELCSPTLHDMRLGTALEAQYGLDDTLTPAEVRRISRGVLREGFAGRLATTAAEAAMAASAELVANTHRELLVRLAAGAGGSGGDVRASAHKSLVAIGFSIGQSIDNVALALERLAHVVADLGLAPATPTGFVSRALGELADLVLAVRRAEASQAESASALPAGSAKFVIANAELALALASRAARTARSRLDDLPRVVADWAVRPAALLEAAARPEWILDGWPRICLLSRTMGGEMNRATILAEMALLVPPMPPQADEWLGLPPGTATRANAPRHGTRGTTPGGPRMPDLVARNEQLLAMAA